MTKVSITVLKKPSGEVEVLAASDDAQVALDAFLDCNEAGEVQFLRKVDYDKRKVNESAPVAKKKAKKAE